MWHVHVITGFNQRGNKNFGIASSYTTQYDDVSTSSSSFPHSAIENVDVENSYHGSVYSGLCIQNAIYV